MTDAFNHFVDIMDRTLCPFLLLDKTARGMVDREKIEGDGIFAGVRFLDFTQSVQSMLKTLASNIDIRLGMEDYKSDENSFSWKFKGVPIQVKLIKQKYGFIENPTHKWYFWDNFKIPNPFEEYWAIRSEIR